MPITTSLTSAQVPTPIAVPAPTFGAPSSPLNTGSPYPGTAKTVNQIAQALELVCQNAAGGYGILTGGVLSSPSGLLIEASNGVFLGDGILELITAVIPSSAFGVPPFYQVDNPGTITLPNGATSYVWLTKTGTLVSDVVRAYPTGAKWFLGTVTTAGGLVTNIDNSGVVSLVDGKFTRQTADIDPPSDAPGFALETVTSAGTYRWNGSAHVYQRQGPNIQTLSATLVLNALSQTVHFLKTNGADQHVRLPNPGLLPIGRTISIFSYDAAHNVIVDDFTGANLCTLTPGQSIQSAVIYNTSGAKVFPASFSPGVPTAGPAVIAGSF